MTRPATGRIRIVLPVALSLCLCLPALAMAKRPPKSDSASVSDIIQKALDSEKAGKVSEAETTLLELLDAVKSDRFREEYEWLSYMNVLRRLISFYYRQGNYKEADWYHREYSDELEDDEDESGMHAIIVFDVKTIAEELIDKGNFHKAEETFLYLKDRLEARLGYRHWLVRLVYKNIVGLYLKMGNTEMAERYSQDLNPASSETPAR